eukprot:jgi/Undpi1/11976/HiC_scaffold_4.g01675.m1
MTYQSMLHEEDPPNSQTCGEDCGNTRCALLREDCIDGLCAPAEGNECAELENECSNFIPCCDTSHDCIVPAEMDTSDNYIRSGFCEVAESSTGGPCITADNCRFEFDLCVDNICKINPSMQIDASEKTTVTVTTNAYDTRDGDNSGCGESGCLAELTRDGDTDDPESRWSCSKNLGEGNCYLEYTFGSPQDVLSLNIAFHKGDERTRKIKVLGDGSSLGTFKSSGTTLGYENWTLNASGVSTIKLVARGLDYNDWLSITEVQLLNINYYGSTAC